MRSTAPFTRLEKTIAAADASTIRQRWEYGRRLLVDPEWTTESGNLRHGAIAELIDAAHKAGEKLSEREIRYRLEAARAHPYESQNRHACADFKSWSAFRESGFPVQYGPEPDEEPFDPRTPLEKARAGAKQLELGNPDQGVLFEYFPDTRFSELSTLAELAKYAAEMAEMTERYARKDRERAEYLKRLIDAVDGDLSKTWEQAQAALDAQGGPPDA